MDSAYSLILPTPIEDPSECLSNESWVGEQPTQWMNSPYRMSNASV
jgi:hypothetical protein